MERGEQVSSTRVGSKPYMKENWWHFLPLYIFIVLAIINIIVIVFSNGVTPGVLLGYVVFAVLWGLLLWWLCDIGQLGWAWFFLLLPLILAVAAATVTAGVVGAMVVSGMDPMSKKA